MTEPTLYRRYNGWWCGNCETAWPVRNDGWCRDCGPAATVRAATITVEPHDAREMRERNA